jgi:hypothetical protein
MEDSEVNSPEGPVFLGIGAPFGDEAPAPCHPGEYCVKARNNRL